MTATTAIAAGSPRRSLLSYVAELTVERDVFGRFPDRVAPRTLLYQPVGSVGVYWITDRDRRLILWMRHYDEHQCPGGTAYCEEAQRLWDQIDERDRPVAIG